MSQNVGVQPVRDVQMEGRQSKVLPAEGTHEQNWASMHMRNESAEVSVG